MRAKRRTFRAYLVEPFKQIRFGLHVVFVSLSFSAIFAYVFVQAFQEQYQHVFELYNAAEMADLFKTDVFERNRDKLAISIIAFVVTTLYVVIRRTHRMYGPMISMMRFVSELKKGNYAVRIHVRERDDFHNFVSELNALAVELQKKHGIPASQSQNQGMDGLDVRLRDIEDGLIVIGDTNDDKIESDENQKAS